jgi:uroporphyrinogen-III decarboxylase
MVRLNNRLTYGLGFAAVLLSGICVAADGLGVEEDAPSRATPTAHESMKDCMEKQKTANVTMSKSQMTRICKEELKRQRESGEIAPPPTDAPRN